MTNPTLTKEYLAQLLANGYTDEVRAFTRRLRGGPDLVLEIERIFDELLLDAAVDWEGFLAMLSLSRASPARIAVCRW